MRITNNMMIANMTRNLQTNIRKLDKTQTRYNTGKRIHKPSDDPIGITRSLKIRTDINELAQFKKNIEDALSWVESTEQAIIGYTEVLKRLRDLTVQGANGVLGKEDTQKIQSEVAELKKQIISQANTTYSGNYIFSGKNTDKELLNAEGRYADLDAAKPDTPIVDLIDNHTIKFQVGIGEQLSINTLGADLFEIDENTPGAGKPAGIIELIEEMENILENGNETGELSNKLDIIDKYMDKALTARGDIGARTNRIELLLNKVEDDIINLRELQSKLEDADLAETAIQLMNEENVYRASLHVGARIIQPTLLDFLR